MSTRAPVYDLIGTFQQRTRPAGDLLPYTTTINAPALTCDVRVLWGLATAASVAASAWHGVKRNRGSVGWGLAWGLGAAVAPVVVPVVAVAQGFGKPAAED